MGAGLKVMGRLAGPTTTPKRTTHLDFQSHDWQEHSLCKTAQNLQLFFPERGGSSKPARTVCGLCPVKEQCLEYALNNKEAHGIWGGTSDRERRLIRKERSATAS